MKEKEILNFIQRRFPQDNQWISGNCFYFATILKTRFPQAEIMYDVIYNHFFVATDNSYYDWTGKINKNSDSYVVSWDQMDSYDSLEKEHVLRDCVL